MTRTGFEAIAAAPLGIEVPVTEHIPVPSDQDLAAGMAGGFQPDYLTDCIVLERLNHLGRELIPVMNGKNYLGTAVRNFDVIKIYPNSSILPKFFCLDTPQNKVLSLNQ